MGIFCNIFKKLFFNAEEIIYHGSKCSFLKKEAIGKFLFVQLNKYYWCGEKQKIILLTSLKMNI